MKRSASLPVSIVFVVLALVSTARAEELGRLFLTPEQRSALDARRKARLPDKPQAVIASPITRIDGFVTRGGGRATVWVNGAAVGEGAEQAGLRVLPRRADPSRVTIEIGEGERKFDMKVGQSLEHATGEVKDPLRGGEAAPYVAPRRSR